MHLPFTFWKSNEQSIKFTPLPEEASESGEKDGDEPCADSFQSRRQSLLLSRDRLSILFFLSLLLNIMLVAALFTSRSATTVKRCSDDDLAYAPAQSAVRLVNKTFASLLEKTKWHGPPDAEVDKAWNDLYYPYGSSALTKEEASRLVNRTTMYPGDDPVDSQKYVVTLDVFHQLHCVNMFRQMAYPDYFGPNSDAMKYRFQNVTGGPELFDHIDHCINSLRQSIMCSSDITPIVYRWNPEREMNDLQANVRHTCRDFEGIQEWAKARRPKAQFQLYGHARGDDGNR